MFDRRRFGLGRSFDNDYVMYALPPWMARPYSASSEVAKRNFDQIDASGGMGGFAKRNFDQMDAGGMGGFSKRNFDKFDRPGFGDFNKRDLGKRNFDMIDKAGFGTFSADKALNLLLLFCMRLKFQRI